jgi:hypothetical protein
MENEMQHVQDGAAAAFRSNTEHIFIKREHTLGILFRFSIQHKNV